MGLDMPQHGKITIPNPLHAGDADDQSHDIRSNSDSHGYSDNYSDLSSIQNSYPSSSTSISPSSHKNKTKAKTNNKQKQSLSRSLSATVIKPDRQKTARPKTALAGKHGLHDPQHNKRKNSKSQFSLDSSSIGGTSLYDDNSSIASHDTDTDTYSDSNSNIYSNSSAASSNRKNRSSFTL